MPDRNFHLADLARFDEFNFLPQVPCIVTNEHGCYQLSLPVTCGPEPISAVSDLGELLRANYQVTRTTFNAGGALHIRVRFE